MRPAGFATKVGSTTDVRKGADVVITHEPETGATLRTKGRFYLLCEVAPPSDMGRDLAREIAEAARDEYYYDLSAGVEQSLRRALRGANRRAAHRLQGLRGRVTLHCAAAVLVNNELHSARIGAAQVFLVRRARLFLPGDEPGELADFVHRTTTREAASLGAEPDLLPAVWRQTIEAGDTLILAGGALTEGLGAEALKNAVVTLHPRAAAEHIHNRFVAEGVAGSDPAILVEIAHAPGAAQRLVAPLLPAHEADEVVIAEQVRSRIDWIWRRRPRIASAAKAVAVPAAEAVTRGVAIGLELLPRRGTALPRSPETTRERQRRRQRLTSLLALLLLVVSALIGTLVLQDFQRNQVAADYRGAIVKIEEDIASATRLATAQRPDFERARERLRAASARIDEASRSPLADEAALAKYRAEIAVLEDKLANVILDLARLAPGSRPVQLVQTTNGLYAADPGSGRLWRVFGEDPVVAAPVFVRGQRDVGAPVAVAADGEVVFAIDDARKIHRAEGNTLAEVTPPDSERWRAITSAVAFVGNLYVLDAASGQLWKHEEERGRFGPALGFLTVALPPNTARSAAVDGDIWVVTTAGEVLRFRRQGLSTTAGRIEFTVRWADGPAPRPAAIQAIDSQRFLYVLDAEAKRIVRLTRDGRETARFALPESLASPSAFYVSEGQLRAYTVHGSKIVVTDISR